MTTDQSITFFIHELQNGKQDNAHRIWSHFYRRLLPLARRHLHQRVRRVVDEEDVALRAMEECFRQLQAGYMPSIRNRDNLWVLLVKITERRALNANRDLLNPKRGAGAVRGHSVFFKTDDSIANGFDQYEGRERTPELGAITAENFERLMKVLEPDQQKVATFKFQGYTNREIAATMRCAVVTVERRLNRIRKRWRRLASLIASSN